MASGITRVSKWAILAGVVAGLAGGASAGAQPSDSTSPSLGLSDFASQVETLGETGYGNSFTGAVVSGTGIDVYANPVTDVGLPVAISSLNSNGYSVTYHPTTLSYDDLDALNNKLGDLQPQLQAAGVQISESAPDPATDSVAVTLTPSADASTTTAAGVLSSIAGPGFTVAAQAVPPAESDTSSQASVTPDAGQGAGQRPFAGGDEIRGPSPFCTGGFGVVGNASGTPFMLTAGHCGRGTWSTPATTMGPTSSLYFRNPAEDDFQTIRVGSKVSGNIIGKVNGASKQYPVVGEDIPAIGARITVDGALTGEKNFELVVANDARQYVHNPNGPNYYAAHQVVVVGAPPVCQGGDSGGPMFLRTSKGNVKAVATVVAYFPTTLDRCTGERISVEEAHSNTHLLLSGG
jgi:hypothetical protein